MKEVLAGVVGILALSVCGIGYSAEVESLRVPAFCSEVEKTLARNGNYELVENEFHLQLLWEAFEATTETLPDAEKQTVTAAVAWFYRERAPFSTSRSGRVLEHYNRAFQELADRCSTRGLSKPK